MSNIYLSTEEAIDCLDNLKANEYKLYILLKGSALKNPTPNYFSNANLAKLMGVKDSTLRSTKAALKKLQYAQIVHFKDEHGDPMVRVIVGKDQMRLYNLGVKCEITNAKAFNKLMDMFPVLDPKYSRDEREGLVKELNDYYVINKGEFQ